MVVSEAEITYDEFSTLYTIPPCVSFMPSLALLLPRLSDLLPNCYTFNVLTAEQYSALKLRDGAAGRVSRRVTRAHEVRANLAYNVYAKEDQSSKFSKDFVQFAWAAVQEIIAMAGLMFGPQFILSAFRILVGKAGDVVEHHCDYPVYGDLQYTVCLIGQYRFWVGNRSFLMVPGTAVTLHGKSRLQEEHGSDSINGPVVRISLSFFRNPLQQL